MKPTFAIGCGAIFLAAACSSTEVRRVGGFGGDGTTTEQDPNGTTDPSKTDEVDAPVPLTKGLAITDVALNQAVKVPIVTKGALVTKRNAPIVANRTGLLRVYVAPTAGFAAREVTCELRLAVGEKKLPVMREKKRISAASTDAALESTFNFEIPAASLADGTTFKLALTTDDGEVTEGASDAQFPKDGSAADLGLDSSGKLRIVVVPIKYDTDGSGRVADTSAAQIDRYKKTLMSVYPATDVEIKVHAPYSWTTTISGNGTGYSSVLNAMTRLRQQERPDRDVYYYALLQPTASMSSFCGGGCVTGLSTVVENPSTSSMRASVGVGFPGQESANTMAHEVGHAHGREHAPCGGAGSPDSSYPYQGGVIGVWGWNVNTKKLIPPTTGRDMMGYCPNEWVSDYTYKALFTRIATIKMEANVSFPTSPGGSFKMAVADESGALTWDGDVDLDEEPAGGELRDAEIETAAGVVHEKAHFFKYDHLPGGVLIVRNAPALQRVRIQGFDKVLAK